MELYANEESSLRGCSFRWTLLFVYLLLAGGMRPFILRYSTSWP